MSTTTVECIDTTDLLTNADVQLAIGYMNGEKALAIFVGEETIAISVEAIREALTLG